MCQVIIAVMTPDDTDIASLIEVGVIANRVPPVLRNIGAGRNEGTLGKLRYAYLVERLVHADAHTLLADINDQGREPVYCDSPHLRATRRSDRRHRFENEECNHLEQFTLLKKRPHPVILSGYPATLYDRTRPGRKNLELPVMH